MNIKAWVPLIVAIVLGGIAAKVGRDMLSRKDAPQKVTVNVTRLVVAKENMAPGTALKAFDLVANNVPEISVTPGTFRDPVILMNRVLTMPVLKGQPILENMLAPEGTSRGLPAIVPDGMRAVTLDVNETSGVAGMLAPGCRIDMVTTLAGEAGQMLSRTIVRNLQIIAVGKRFGDPAVNQPGKEPGKEPGKDEAPEQAPARTVTLLATPREAQLIDLAVHTGSPRLVLRGSRDSRGDLQNDLESVTIAELRGSTDRSSGMSGLFTKLIETIARATPPTKPTSLFNDAPTQPATRPAEQTRMVTIIRNTKEQAVQIETRTESKPSTFVETDRGFINKNEN